MHVTDQDILGEVKHCASWGYSGHNS